MKQPAAKTGTPDPKAKSNAKAANWASQAKKWANIQAEEEGEEEQKEEDPVEDAEQEARSEARDYAKARNLARFLQQGSLPDDVKKMYDEAGKKSTSRLFGTKLINALFQKSTTGEWVLATDTPTFQAFLDNQDMKLGSCELAGVPASVML